MISRLSRSLLLLAFVLQTATPALWVVAVFSFFGILLGSSAIGIVFGMLSTLCFKYMRLGHKASNGIAEASVLLVFAYTSYAFGA